MYTDVIKLAIIFLSIVLAMKFAKKLLIAIAIGSLVTVLVYRMEFMHMLGIVGKSALEPMTIETLLAFYMVTFLQRMLEQRGQLKVAQQSLDSILNNRRLNTFVAPIFIGMMPSAGAVTICGAIVDEVAGDSLDVEEKTFVTSYYRHITESFLPTYTTIMIGVKLGGVPLPSFLIGMLPMVAALIIIGYFFYIRKIPKETGIPSTPNKGPYFKSLFLSLWPIALIIVLIIAFNFPVYLAAATSILLNILFNRYKWAEIRPMLRSAFEPILLLSTLFIMIFKGLLLDTGAISRLPAAFSSLPIPSFLIFFLLFFFGSLLAGQQAINVVALPLAFATVPNAGMPLLVLLMATGYAAMQLSPTHVCLAIVTEYFGVSMGSLIKKTLPVLGCFFVVLISYYLILTQFM